MPKHTVSNTQHMYVFIDDSGDAGMKLDQGSSKYIVMAACIFYTREAIANTLAAINTVRNRYEKDGETIRYLREFKYSKTKLSLKDEYFTAIKDCDFHIRVIFLDKEKLHSDYLRSHPEDLKLYMIKQMLTKNYGKIRHAKIVIDGEDKRAFQFTKGAQYITTTVNAKQPYTISEVEFADSKKNELIQLADMIAGAVHGYLKGNPDSDRHVATFRARTYQPYGTWWDFH